MPHILIIDDLFGRIDGNGRNPERENLCGQFLIADITGDSASTDARRSVREPVARVEFARGQRPLRAAVGDSIENDLDGIIELVRERWLGNSTDRWALVLVDLCFYTGNVTASSNSYCSGMPEGRAQDSEPGRYFGLKIIKRLHKEFPDLPVAVLSSMAREDVSREISDHGALGFLPRDVEDGPSVLADFIRRHGLIPDADGQIVGTSRKLLTALRSARRAAVGAANLLLLGERGSGKELLARYAHVNSSEAEDRPFVTVNSAVLSAELFASELFGIERGVATGVEARKGLFRAAHEGDLFFDEIRDMVPQAQAGILRVLDERRLSSVGSVQSEDIDVRVLAASNEDVSQLSDSGKFRLDLLDRLREGGTITMPPLRERKEDIPFLVRHFVDEVKKQNRLVMDREVTTEALEILAGYDWPGNIRELRSVIRRAVLEYPDVDYMVPIHFLLEERAPLGGFRADLEGPWSIDRVLGVLGRLSVDAQDRSACAGTLPKMREAFGEAQAKALLSALKATLRVSPDHPEGKISLQGALRLLSGDPKLTTAQSADTIKQILTDSIMRSPAFAGEPLLVDAIDNALRLRPRGGRGPSSRKKR